MTKHNKKHMMGGVKRTIVCPDCDYSVKASIREAENRFKLHMKNKHNIDSDTIDRLPIGKVITDSIGSSQINTDALMMADLLKLLK